MDKASDLAFLDNIDELNTVWPDYQVRKMGSQAGGAWTRRSVPEPLLVDLAAT